MVLTVYHYLNTIGDQCLIKIKTWSEYIIPYKTEVATDVTDVQMLLILIMNKNVTLHPNSSYDQMCISKRQKVILLSFIL